MPTQYEKGSQERYNGGIIRRTTSGGWVAEINRDGKRRRASFDKKSKCKSWIDAETTRRDGQGKDAFKLNRLQIIDAADAIHKLKKAGHSKSLCYAVDFFLKHNPKSDVQLTLEEVVQAYESELKNPTDGGDAARESSIRNKRRRLGAFLEVHGAKDVRAITEADVKAWAETFEHLAPRTQLNRKVELQSVLNFAERLMPGYENTVCKLKQRRAKGAAAAAILTPKQAEDMLRYMEENKPGRYALTLALYLFAGLRPQELIPRDGKSNPMQWGAIRLDRGKVHVLPEISKTGHDRQITISDNLRKWIERYPGEGRIAPEANAFDEARREAAKEAGVKRWVQDFTRHTYGTYAAELNGIHAAAESMGHVTGLSVFKRHYEGRATPQAAAAFFEIKPTPAKSGKVIQIKTA
jgi:integrase